MSGNSERRADQGGTADPLDDDSGSLDTQMGQQDILRVQMQEALSELNRPTSGLFISALSAGLDIGFGPLLMAVILTVAEFSFTSPLLRELRMVNAYALGFIFVILGRSELFPNTRRLRSSPSSTDVPRSGNSGGSGASSTWGTWSAGPSSPRSLCS